MEKNDVPMIEQYKVESTMAYACKIVRDVKIIIAIVMAAITLIVYTFVSLYNVRNTEMLNTLTTMQQQITEVLNEKTENLQQRTPP